MTDSEFLKGVREYMAQRDVRLREQRVAVRLVKTLHPDVWAECLAMARREIEAEQALLEKELE